MQTITHPACRFPQYFEDLQKLRCQVLSVMSVCYRRQLGMHRPTQKFVSVRLKLLSNQDILHMHSL
jgi:hypothetical protein